MSQTQTTSNPVVVNSKFFGNNPRLKAANVQIAYTKANIEEYIKCSKDPIYFAETYGKIVTLDGGITNLVLYDFQKEIMRAYHNNRFVISCIARQSGKSTVTLFYVLWCVLFKPNYRIAFLANKEKTAKELLARLQLAYEFLPFWLQQGVVEWNKFSIMFENGSKLLVAATSSSSARGDTFNTIVLDEFAFVPTHIAEEFYASIYPTISTGKESKLLIVSTPNGLNHFYKMWSNAVNKKSQFVPIHVPWDKVPGRDAKWKEETIANTSEKQFEQEFDVSFLGSSNTLISTNTIRRMPVVDPIHSNNGLDIYEEPKAYAVAKDGTKKRTVYAMSVDCSEGVGLDYSTIVVIDVTTYPFRLVAKYRANNISPLVLPQIIYDVGKYYNWADCLIETNGIGSQVVAILNFDLEYPNIVAFSFGRGELGLKTTKTTKSVGVSNLKIMLERDKLLITDYDVIQELSVFVPKGTSYAAEPGYNDDLVMALVNFSWFTTTDYFKNLTDTDLRLKIMEERNKAMEETEIMPFGILVDGINDDDGELQWTDSDLGLNW